MFASMFAATQQSQVFGNQEMDNIIESRPKKNQGNVIGHSKSRNQATKRPLPATQTRSAAVEPVQEACRLPRHASQPVQPGSATKSKEIPPPRIRSQRLLHKRLSTPITGPGSSKDNEIVIE